MRDVYLSCWMVWLRVFGLQVGCRAGKRAGLIIGLRKARERQRISDHVCVGGLGCVV